MDEPTPRTGPGPAEATASVSRAPVVVLIVGLALAVGLVIFGAELAGRPAQPPHIPQPGTVDVPRDVNVIMRDYVFNPTPLYLVAGETVRFNIINGGLVEHEFVLGDATVQAAWRDADAAATAPAPFATPVPASVPPSVGGVRVVLPSGASTSVLYSVPDHDGLELFCHLPGHVEQGMVGQVIVLSR